MSNSQPAQLHRNPKGTRKLKKIGQRTSRTAGTRTGKPSQVSKRKVRLLSPTSSRQHGYLIVVHLEATIQGSKTYILRSTLDSKIIESAAATDASILAQESADAPDGDDDDEVGTNPYGSIIAWNSSDQLGALGILHVVLAIILVNGRVISDSMSAISPRNVTDIRNLALSGPTDGPQASPPCANGFYTPLSGLHPPLNSA